MSSLQDYTFEWLVSEQIPLANKFYQQHGIRGKVGRHDRCAILRQENQELVAVAVLKSKSNFDLLTHVAVIERQRRRGLASYLMSQMRNEFNSSTYCFPFVSLELLYTAQDFVKINESLAVEDALRQYLIYRKQGRDIVLMRYQASNNIVVD
ncbi:MAG: GNAT family N-acetyltransferase [Gammaproteobacteria bacterium]|nr:GNAT family N-acetyltransferase [Gammaproteobacteria bacterium]